MHARSADNQQRTTNHIVLPSIKISSIISNDVFNIDAPGNGVIRLNRGERQQMIYTTSLKRKCLILQTHTKGRISRRICGTGGGQGYWNTGGAGGL